MFFTLQTFFAGDSFTQPESPVAGGLGFVVFGVHSDGPGDAVRGGSHVLYYSSKLEHSYDQY